MTTFTRISLVLLRLAIGWHFLFEGLEKLDTLYHGPREGKPAWSAGGYLSESQGPFAWWFRHQAGEPDQEALARLTLPPDANKLPSAVETDWADQFQRFTDHYHLGHDHAVQPEYIGILAISPAAPFPSTLPWPMLAKSAPNPKTEHPQLALAKEDLSLARTAALAWFTHGSREVPSKLPGVSEKIKETTQQRIADYHRKIQQLAEMEEQAMPAFDRDVWKEKYRALKQEIVLIRTDLLRDLDKPVQDAMRVAKFRLSKSQLDKGPVPDPPAPPSNLERINLITAWGLTIIGGCLLLGFRTRTACVFGAVFLLMVVLSRPALPWLPANPRAEGHYFYIDKNIIEMLALLALATTASGRWLGLDVLLFHLNPFRRRV